MTCSNLCSGCEKAKCADQKPMREAPAKGTPYYLPDVLLQAATQQAWRHDAADLQYLEKGLAYATEEGALARMHSMTAAQPAGRTESVLIDGVAYTIPATVAGEMLRLHMEIQGGAVEPAILPEADDLEGDARQAHDQCRAVIYMAEALASVYRATASLIEGGHMAHDIVGPRAAAAMEWLGDALNGMDAVADGDTWMADIFARAQERWPIGVEVKKRELSIAESFILDERDRQVEVKGWTPERDDEHEGGEIGRAAACYALAATGWCHDMKEPPAIWPWDAAAWKPTHGPRDLEKAGALVIAELERQHRCEGFMLVREGSAA